MATDNQVKDLMATELQNRSPKQFQNAGDNWSKQVLGFFFPKNEDTVDLCALAVLDNALAQDGTTIPKKARKSVAILISTGTVVKDAVKIISLTTLRPIP